MRTTLNLDDGLMRAVKVATAEGRTTMTAFIEQAISEALEKRERAAVSEFRLHLPTVEGGLRPGVDLADRDALYDLMEDRS